MEYFYSCFKNIYLVYLLLTSLLKIPYQLSTYKYTVYKNKGHFKYFCILYLTIFSFLHLTLGITFPWKCSVF